MKWTNQAVRNVSILRFAVLLVLLLAATTTCGDDPFELEKSCGVSSKSIDFGTVLLGTSAEQSVTITANGSAALIGTVELSTESSCDQFSLVEGAGPYNLSPGESLEVKINFTPSSPGSCACVLDAGDSKCANVSLLGIGDAPSSCSIDSLTIDFGTTFAGEQPTETFTITNSGGDTLSGDVSISSDAPCDGFEIVSGVGPYSLTEGQSHAVTVAFDPPTSGSKSCRIETGSVACTDVELTGRRYPGWVLKDDVDWGGDCFCDPWLRDIVFSSSNVLFAVGYEYVDCMPCEYLLVSWNGGASWRNVQDEGGQLTGFRLRGLAMASPEEGVVVGEGGRAAVFFHDHFSNIGYQVSNTGTTNHLYAVSMAGPHGIAVGFQTIIRTSDGGRNWVASQQTLTGTLWAIDMIDASAAVAVGPAGAAMLTADGGASWTPHAMGVSVDLNGVDFVNANTGWIVGEGGTIFRTKDGGLNWISLDTSIFQTLGDVSFVDESNGVVVGGSGGIWRTFDGGDTWRQELSPTSAPPLGVALLDPEVGVICGVHGTILRLE